jgi:hypothetical protein
MFVVLSLFSLYANSFAAGTMFFIALMVKTEITINGILEYKQNIAKLLKTLQIDLYKSRSNMEYTCMQRKYHICYM